MTPTCGQRPYLYLVGKPLDPETHAMLLEARHWTIETVINGYAPQAILFTSSDSAETTVATIRDLRQIFPDVPVCVIADPLHPALAFAAAGAAMMLPHGTPPAYITANIITAAQQAHERGKTKIWCVQLDDRIFMLHPDSKTFALLWSGLESDIKVQRMSDLETKLLTCLMRQNGISFSKQLILEEVWRRADADSEATLRTHMVRLRKHMRDDVRSSRLMLPRSTNQGYAISGTISVHLTDQPRLSKPVIDGVLAELGRRQPVIAPAHPASMPRIGAKVGASP